MPDSSYVPPFTLTSVMVNLIAGISELVGQLTVNGSLQRNPHLRRNNRIQTIHSSLAIENNTLTLSQVTNIIQGKRVLGPPDEIREVKNAYAAYEQLLRLNPYSLDDLLHTHKILMADLVQEAGVLRSGGVGVFAGTKLVHLAPPAQFVSGQLTELLAWCEQADVHPLIKSCVFHAEFEFIHPFVDGNGRMGRMWQTLLLSTWKPLFAWLPVESLIEKHQTQYYAALDIAGKQGNSTVFVEFMLEILRTALEDAIVSARYDTVNEIVYDTVSDAGFETLNITQKEEAILEIIRKNRDSIITDIVQKTGFSRATVTRALASLKKKGILERVGSDKTGYWKITGLFYR